MAALIDDELLGQIAVVGTPGEVAESLYARYGSLAARLAFASPYPLSQECASDIISRLRTRMAPA
jgi:alkanesulfonate monooxygenase SsuD/methylene tetrahydromethanopterin reductase-like flavin-dependent oxidoreductase (luciferase family)